jgi:ATP synthase F1 epsilon subunit
MSLRVEIVTPSQIAHKGDADMVCVPGLLGEFGAMDAHASMLSVTRAGRVSLTEGAEHTTLIIGPGFAEVGADQLTLLVDHCEAVGTVDAAQAKADLVEGYEMLAAHDAESEQGLAATKKIDLALARLGDETD